MAISREEVVRTQNRSRQAHGVRTAHEFPHVGLTLVPTPIRYITKSLRTRCHQWMRANEATSPAWGIDKWDY